jgi:hypothetical protein
MKAFLCVIGNNNSCMRINATDWKEALVKLFVWNMGHNIAFEKAIRNTNNFEEANTFLKQCFYDSDRLFYFGEVTDWYLNNLYIIE